MIPSFTSAGRLPEGVHEATWDEFAARFGGTDRRVTLLAGLLDALQLLREAGCLVVLIGGSFVTAKPEPGDVDVAWSIVGVNPFALDPIFSDFSQDRAAQKRRFGAEFFPAEIREGDTGRPFGWFFQYTKSDERVGIVLVELDTLP